MVNYYLITLVTFDFLIQTGPETDEKQCQTTLSGGDVDKMVQNFTNSSHILKVITCNQYNEEDFQDDKKV